MSCRGEAHPAGPDTRELHQRQPTAFLRPQREHDGEHTNKARGLSLFTITIHMPTAGRVSDLFYGMPQEEEEEEKKISQSEAPSENMIVK